MNFNPSALEVQPVQVIKLWENPEGTKSTRATVALINGYRRVTRGKYFRILKEDEAKKCNLPFKQWLPEKKGKHLCLAPYEVKGLCDNLKQILESLEEAEHFSYECDRRVAAAVSGPGYSYQRAAPYTNADSQLASAGKKRGRKPKGNNNNSIFAKADAQEDCDEGYVSDAKRQHHIGETD